MIFKEFKTPESIPWDMSPKQNYEKKKKKEYMSIYIAVLNWNDNLVKYEFLS